MPEDNEASKPVNNRRPRKNPAFKKRQAPKFYKRENDFYVTNKTNFKLQFQQCEAILISDIGEVYLHCIGNAINRGINLALKLKAAYPDSFEFEVNTSTITLTGKL
jgi:ribonuclease P/MRP protein subunit RPP20